MSEENIKKNNPENTTDTGVTNPVNSLRSMAENIIQKKTGGSEALQKPLPPDVSLRLIHELEVRQVELELQNQELLRIQAELEKSRSWLSDLYDFAPVGYFTLNEHGLIMDINLTAASMLGVRRKSLCRHMLTEYIHHDDRDIYSLHQKELFRTGAKQQFELRIIKTNGSFLWLRMETTLAYDENNMLTCRGVISDITEQIFMEEEKQKYEEQRMKNQRLESLGILAGGIAHNFNNLLSGIFGYIELADKAADNPQVTRFLSEALSMSERAKVLTGQLLTFSRGGAPVKRTGDLFPLIMDSVQFALSGSDIACRYDIQQDLRICHFDPGQISQVIEDVILNARQAMTNGGIIDVSASNVHLSTHEVTPLPEGMYIMISIRDSGVGMSPDILSKIFDPFFTTKTAGHGLGLATGYSIISRHGGTIVAESEPGKGSLVKIYLPAAAEISHVHKDEETAKEIHHGEGTIIIMDDNECIRDSLSEMLMSMGYDVFHMEDGSQVLSFFNDESNSGCRVAAAILDMVIPGGMGGKDTASEIRKIDSVIPLFAITGGIDDSVLLNPEKFGFTASIRKPFLMSELAGMLNRYLNNNPH